MVRGFPELIRLMIDISSKIKTMEWARFILLHPHYVQVNRCFSSGNSIHPAATEQCLLSTTFSVKYVIVTEERIRCTTVRSHATDVYSRDHGFLIKFKSPYWSIYTYFIITCLLFNQHRMTFPSTTISCYWFSSVDMTWNFPLIAVK